MKKREKKYHSSKKAVTQLKKQIYWEPILIKIALDFVKGFHGLVGLQKLLIRASLGIK